MDVDSQIHRPSEQGDVKAVSPRLINTPPDLTYTGMNLTAALVAERCYQTAEGETGSSGSASDRLEQTEMAGGTLLRVSLMRLLEEARGRE